MLYTTRGYVIIIKEIRFLKKKCKYKHKRATCVLLMEVDIMLIGFTIKNFKSFYDENIFTMRSSSDTKFREINTVETKYDRLIKSAFIFGANGSGKSNFIKAIAYMKGTVLAELNVQGKMISNVNNFLFSETADEIPTALEVEFITEGVVYTYGFEILNGEVNREYLYKKTKRKTPVFDRKSPAANDIYFFGEDMDNVREFAKNTSRDTLFLYWANDGNNEMAVKVYKWFEKIQIFDAENARNLFNDTIGYLEESKDGKDNVLDLLQRADVSIVDFDIEISEKHVHSEVANGVLENGFAEVLLPDGGYYKEASLMTKHHIYNKNWEEVGTVSRHILEEASGTRKIIEAAGPIIKALENGSILFVDEMDSRLHPMLVKNLVMMFNSSSGNPKNAQLICNTHDALLLDEDIRRDQIYFIEKDEYGVSKLYSLTDFRAVRKESKLLKQYLFGVFGATPKLQDYFVAKKFKEGIYE